MSLDDVLARLRAFEPELRRSGVAHAGVFGSVARGESTAQSDIDVLIRFDPAATVTLWDYAGLKRRVAKMLGASRTRVDVIDLDGLSASVKQSAERDAVYAF